MLVTIATLPLTRHVRARDRAAALAAAAAYQEAFNELDAYARELRADGWYEGAEIVQRRAEIAYVAARAELRRLEETS